MSKWDVEYLKLCKEILTTGTEVENRTGTNTIKIPFKTFEFDLQDEFPILTTKFVAWKAAILELLWFYQVQSNDVRWLQERGVTIWNEWQIDENGYYQGVYKGIENAYTIGTAYGYIVKKFQLSQNVIETLKNNPNDRRMNMSLWQNDYLETAILPSCVWDSMWDVTDGKLSSVVIQRSCDVGLGLPFNVTQYAVLTHMLAQVTGLEIGKMLYVIKDAHIYLDHIDQINEQLKTYEELGDFEAPKLWINNEINDFFAFDNSKELKDIKLLEYKHHKKIEMPISV